MAYGNPRLATWASGVVRLYELSGAGFVQIGTASHAASGTYVAEISLFWPHDSAYLGVYAGDTTSAYVHTYDMNVVEVAQSGIVPGSTVTGNRIGAYCNAFDFFYGKLGGDGSARGGATVIGLDGIPGATTNFLVNGVGGPAEGSFSPDGTFVVRSGSGGIDGYFRDTAYGDGDDPALIFPTTNSFTIPSNGDATEFAWTSDADLLIATFAGNAALAYVRNGQALAQLAAVDGGARGGSVAVAVHPNNRTVVVSFLTGGVYSTVAYDWDGAALTEFASIENFGKLLSFSANGDLLIDAGSVKARSYDGTFTSTAFTANDTIMANVTAANKQSMSTHTINLVDLPSTLYDTGLLAMAKQQIDFTALKATLLVDGSFMSQEHATLAEVTNNGANEVASGGWPAGGVALTGYRTVESLNDIEVFFDDAAFTVTGGPLDYRYVVVYDSSDPNGLPILYSEGGLNQTVVVGDEIVLSSPPDGMFRFHRS